MTSRMPERARTEPWEPQGSNPLGPPGPELRTRLSLRACVAGAAGAYRRPAGAAFVHKAGYERYRFAK